MVYDFSIHRTLGKVMKRSILLLTLALGFSTNFVSATEIPRGSLLELHSCELYAGGCTVSSEATQGGRYMLRVWDFSGGGFNGANLKGLQVALLQTSPDNLAAADSKATETVAYLPASATAVQREALVGWIKSRQAGCHLENLQTRVVPLNLQKNDAGFAFSAGQFISVQTKSLEKCDSGSCGEALWYEPRTVTSVFTVAVNRTSEVREPLLKLNWTDSSKRSVFLGRFGESTTEVFVTMSELCGTAKSLF
jgi:hypothetical protein